jgi:uncharacterized protein with GYD domain
MAKFLINGSYTAEGAKGLIKEGGTGRKAAVQKALEGLGGKLDAIYYTFGADDVVVICDMPDSISALALSLAVNVRCRADLDDTTGVRRRRRHGVQESRQLPTSRFLAQRAAVGVSSERELSQWNRR